MGGETEAQRNKGTGLRSGTVGTWRSEDLGPGLFEVKAHVPSTILFLPGVKEHLGVCKGTAVQAARRLRPEGGAPLLAYTGGRPPTLVQSGFLKWGALSPTGVCPTSEQSGEDAGTQTTS